MLDKVRIISAEEVNKVLSMKLAIEQMRSAFIQFSTGKAANPIRTAIEFSPEKGNVLFMPSYLAETGKTGVKVITLLKENYKRNLPFIHILRTWFY